MFFFSLSVNVILFSQSSIRCRSLDIWVVKVLLDSFFFTFQVEYNTGLCSLRWLAGKLKPSPEVTMETVKQSHILFRWRHSLVGFPKTLAALSSKGTFPKRKTGKNTLNSEGQTLEHPRESNCLEKKKKNSFICPCGTCGVGLNEGIRLSAPLCAH